MLHWVEDLSNHIGKINFYHYWMHGVINPIMEGKVPRNWTNNNCKSANHILKSATMWKRCHLPHFIHLLYDIVQGEQVEQCWAIRDNGNTKLSRHFTHHSISTDLWSSISQEQRNRRETRFLSDKGKRNLNTIVYTDETCSSAAKKKLIKLRENVQKGPGHLQQRDEP